MLAAADIDDHSPLRHLRERLRVQDAARLPGQRQQADHDIRAFEDRVELFSTGIDGDIGIGLRSPRPGGDVEPHVAQDPGRFPRHRAVAEKTDGAFLRPFLRRFPPFLPRLALPIGGHLAVQPEHVHDGVFGHHRIAVDRFQLGQRNLRQPGMSYESVHPRLTGQHRLEVREFRPVVRAGAGERQVFDIGGIAGFGPEPHFKVRQFGGDRRAPLRLRSHHQVADQKGQGLRFLPCRRGGTPIRPGSDVSASAVCRPIGGLSRSSCPCRLDPLFFERMRGVAGSPRRKEGWRRNCSNR